MFAALGLIPAWAWRWLAVLVLLGACFGTGYLKGREAGKAAGEADLARFQAKVEAEAVKASQAAIAQQQSDAKRKADADAQNATSLAALRADNGRLRNARPAGGFVPAAAPGARSPETACFDRTQLDGALRNFDSAVEGLVGEGDEARVNLDTAKRWAGH